MKKFPLVRFKQFVTNPPFFIFWCKRFFSYKQSSFRYKDKIKTIKQLSAKETLDYITKNNVSLIRFGDGEFGMLFGAGIYPPDSDWSQRYTKKLKETLERELVLKNKNILIGIPPIRQVVYRESDNPKQDVISSMHTEARLALGNLSRYDLVYGDWSVFLPQMNPDLDWAPLKKYLENKTVVIVTGGIEKLQEISLGQKTYFVECGKHNAFSRREEIFVNIDNLIIDKSLKTDQSLFMVSLGCTAGVVVEHLSAKGFTAFDTGHIFRFAMEKVKQL